MTANKIHEKAKQDYEYYGMTEFDRGSLAILIKVDEDNVLKEGVYVERKFSLIDRVNRNQFVETSYSQHGRLVYLPPTHIYIYIYIQTYTNTHTCILAYLYKYSYSYM